MISFIVNGTLLYYLHFPCIVSRCPRPEHIHIVQNYRNMPPHLNRKKLIMVSLRACPAFVCIASKRKSNQLNGGVNCKLWYMSMDVDCFQLPILFWKNNDNISWHHLLYVDTSFKRKSGTNLYMYLEFYIRQRRKWA